MIPRFLKVCAVSALLVFSSFAYAQNDDSAGFFTRLYSSLCKLGVQDTEALRSDLTAKHLPELPAEKAKLFLPGFDGHAWPIPHNGKLGDFVLALPSGKHICAVYARRVDVQSAELLFTQFVSKPPAPLVVEKRGDSYMETGPNGRAHTVSYIWSVPGENRKLLFVLSTAPSPDALIQAVSTISVIGE
jgi:hypothetical protein